MLQRENGVRQAISHPGDRLDVVKGYQREDDSAQRKAGGAILRSWVGM